MLDNIKIYSEDIYWNQIFSDLGAVLTDSPNNADVVFDDSDITTPISANELKNYLIMRANNSDIIEKIFGRYVVLPQLQHKIIVMLYKNPDVNMVELKSLIGMNPDITTHTVENAIYNLRKIYGHDFILNTKGTYRIGKL